MRKIIFAAVVFLSGCAQHFTRPDYTEELFQRDWTDCEVKANQAGYGGIYARDFLRRCMIGKGWKAE